MSKGAFRVRRYVLTGALGLLVLLGGFWLGQQAAAQGGVQPGSAQDPIVTESYVTQAITNALSGQVTPMVSQAVQTAITQQLAPLVQSTVTQDLAKQPQAQSLAVVTLVQGQELVAQQGTEFILRSGAASVLLPPAAAGGFSDLTGGKDIGQGGAVPANHLLLAARSDGRSIVPKTPSCLVIVIGAYVVQPAN